MSKTRVWITLVCCLFTVASVAGAQTRKPGLWETTTTMTFQQSPMPPGMQAPPGSPFGGGPRTTQVCLTQAMIDKYGAPMPTSRGDCQGRRSGDESLLREHISVCGFRRFQSTPYGISGYSSSVKRGSSTMLWKSLSARACSRFFGFSSMARARFLKHSCVRPVIESSSARP